MGGMQYHLLILASIPVIFFGISFIQVKHPVMEYVSFSTALQQHNKALASALGETHSNASVPLYDEMTRLRLSLKGRQSGETADFKMVLHLAMGIGDSKLPNRIGWLPALLCCFASVSVFTVIVMVILTRVMDDFASNKANPEMGDEHISSNEDTILRARKIENPHQPKEMTDDTRRLNMSAKLSVMSSAKWQPVVYSFPPILVVAVAISLQALLLEVVQGGGLAIKMFGIFRRTASLSPMECENVGDVKCWTVLDYIILVLNFPIQIVFCLALARVVSSFNVLFYFFFGKTAKERPLMLA